MKDLGKWTHARSLYRLNPLQKTKWPAIISIIALNVLAGLDIGLSQTGLATRIIPPLLATVCGTTAIIIYLLYCADIIKNFDNPAEARRELAARMEAEANVERHSKAQLADEIHAHFEDFQARHFIPDSQIAPREKFYSALLGTRVRKPAKDNINFRSDLDSWDYLNAEYRPMAARICTILFLLCIGFASYGALRYVLIGLQTIFS